MPPCTMQKDGSEWDVVSAITLFSKEWVKAVGMAYVDDADSPTTESEDFEGSDFEEAEQEKEENTLYNTTHTHTHAHQLRLRLASPD